VPPTGHDPSPERLAPGSAVPLSGAFFLRPTLTVARHLLGKILEHRAADGTTAGRIVEVEAYRGPMDQAAHTRDGHRSARNETMYGPGGHAYVYFIYGMHHCINVVTRPRDFPEAVLIRALEPIRGLDVMRARRGPRTLPDWQLCRGPGSLCRALGIERRHDGHPLTRGRLRILGAPAVPSRLVRRTARIGIDYAGADAARPWRFLVADCRAVSGRRAS
jgi:DNA-3-methyladenine glycosylase